MKMIKFYLENPTVARSTDNGKRVWEPKAHQRWNAILYLRQVQVDFRFARDLLYGRTEEVIDHKRALRLGLADTARLPQSKSVYRLPLSAVFLGGYSRLFSSCHPGCQCPQKTEIPPAVFTRFITYRVNAEWLPVLRKLVPLISLVRTHSLTDRKMAH